MPRIQPAALVAALLVLLVASQAFLLPSPRQPQQGTSTSAPTRALEAALAGQPRQGFGGRVNR